MFERYSEDARKSIFYARYEASLCGSPRIEPQHVLAGLLQADGALALRLFGSAAKIDSIRDRLVKPTATTPGPTVDLPFSIEGRRVLAYAAEESERLNSKQIGSVHMMIGLCRESGTLASAIFAETGVSLERLRQEAGREPESQKKRRALDVAAILNKLRHGVAEKPDPDYSKDLTAAANEGLLDPLIGREEELGRMMQVLLRRRRNWVALTGEPGVGKTALITGLAQQICDGTVPPQLHQRRVLSIAAALYTESRDYCQGAVILCVEGLFDLSVEKAVKAIGHLAPQALRHDARIVGTGSLEGFRRLPAPLAAMFEEVDLFAASEAESLRILAGLKESYERCHAVTIAEDAISAAVTLSRGFHSRRVLPDRALDLLDNACAYARLQKKDQVTAAEVAAAR